MSQQYPATYSTTRSKTNHSTRLNWLNNFNGQVIDLAVTPASDSRVSPASSNNALPSPASGSSHTPTQTVLVHPNYRGGGTSTPGKVRKRQKPESDGDDEDDVMSAGMDTNVPRPNPDRL